MPSSLIEVDLFDPAITRIPYPALSPNEMTPVEKKTAIAGHVKAIMEVLGLDLTDDSLSETPERIARMYVDEIFSGLDTKTFPKMTFVANDALTGPGQEPIIIKAGFTSFCEHHFVPMIGQAIVAYIPKDRLLGLSKISRIVKYFAKRPQLQERLTAQVADSLCLILDIEDVAVITRARHMCVMARGVEDEQNETTVSVLRGQFRTDKSLLGKMRNEG